MFNSRAVPGWIILGVILSVVVGILLLVLLPDVSAQVIFGTTAAVAGLWIALSVVMARHTDPDVWASLLEEQKRFETARSKSLAPAFRRIGTLLGVSKPVENPELTLEALVAFVNELATARSQLNEAGFQALLAERTATFDRLAQETQTKLEQARAADQSLKDSRQQSAELAKQIAQQRREVGELGNELGKSRTELGKVQRQLGKTNESLAIATRQLAETAARVEKLSTEADAVELSLPATLRQLAETEQQLGTLTEQRDQLLATVNELTIQAEALRRERSAAEVAVAQASTQLNELQAALTHSEERQSALAEEEARLLESLPSLQSEVEAIRLAVTDAEFERGSLANELAQLRREQRSVQSSLASIENALERKRIELEECLALIAKRDELKRSLDLLGAQIAARRESGNVPSRAVRTLNTPKRPTACPTCASLTEQLRAAIAEREATHAAQAQMRQEFEAEIAKLQTELASAPQALSKLQQPADSASDQTVAELRAQLADLQTRSDAELAAQQTKLSALEASIAEIEKTRRLEELVWQMLHAEHEDMFLEVLARAEVELGVGGDEAQAVAPQVTDSE